MKTFEPATAGLLFALTMPAWAATDAPLTIVKHGEQTLAPVVSMTPVAQTEAETGQAGEVTNRLRFVTGDEADEYSRRMRERLTDPEQRATLRAEQRTSVRQEYSDAGKVLGLDEATESALFELLTNQRMRLLEQMHVQPRAPFDALRQADEATRHMDAVSKVLGEQGVERFQDYVETLGERRRVGIYSARLTASDKLSRDQEERLIGLLRERRWQAIESVQRSRWLLKRWDSLGFPFQEQLQRESQLETIRANEDTWRRTRDADREMESKAATFLSPAQLAELSKYCAEEQATLLRWIESARAQAGLDTNIPEHAPAPADDPEQPRVAAGVQLQVEIRLKVNRAEPTVVTQIVRNGESFTFATAEGLIAEATPTLYEDDWLDLMMTFYEPGSSGPRRLLGSSFGLQIRLNDGTPHGGGGSSVITGRKGYAIDAMINATAL